MNSNVVDQFLYPVSPILILWVGTFLLIFLELLKGKVPAPLKFGATGLTLGASLAAAGGLFQSAINPLSNVTSTDAPWLREFSVSYHLSQTVVATYLAIGVFTLLSVVFIYYQFKESEVLGEIMILLLFVASGMMLLVSAASLIMIFLALELLSLPTYVLVGIKRLEKKSAESAMKYFLFGSFASVLLVFGIALIYATFGTMHIAQIQQTLAANPAMYLTQPLLLCGTTLLLVAVGFKVGIVPFHMWLPDVYEGAPASITGFMGSAVKLAGFGLVLRILWGMLLPVVQHWSSTLCLLAVITMMVGNIAGLMQDNLKRLFAYSSIAHAGYLFLGVASVSSSTPNANALFFYLLAYGLMFIGLFAIITWIEQTTGRTEIYELSGLGFTNPVLGVCLALFVLSGAGIPPTAGFFAKYFIFIEAVKAGQTPYVVVAVISSLIGAYYYLRVLVYLYMKEAKTKLELPRPPILARVGMAICAACMLIFSFWPALLNFATR